jgi:hypothetical protein
MSRDAGGVEPPRTEGISPQEEVGLREDLREGRTPRCPRCDGPLHVTALPPRSDVSYVRDRIHLHCRACRLRFVLDRR